MGICGAVLEMNQNGDSTFAVLSQEESILTKHTQNNTKKINQ